MCKENRREMWEAMQGKVDEYPGPKGQKGKLEGGGANEHFSANARELVVLGDHFQALAGANGECD